MRYNIEQQIESINDAIEWIRKNHPDEYEERFFMLVEERRKLKSIEDALENNPGIAAYGARQSGKPYLMERILHMNGKPFFIEANGKKYDFFLEMYPNRFAGVVIRYTSFSNDPARYSETYPILMRCLSVTDIITILAEGYYNSVWDHTGLNETEITEKAENIYGKYIGYPADPSSPVQPDDMLSMKHYFKHHLNKAQSFLNTDFFSKVALVADRIPSSDWVDVFSILWNSELYLTRLFLKMAETLSILKYSKYIYLPAEALFHEGIDANNTINSMQCLDELFEAKPKYLTDAYLRHGDEYEKISGLSKGEVCAVCAEIIVKISKDILENVGTYDFQNMADASVSRLDSKEVEMTMFEECDLLDFPGVTPKFPVAPITPYFILCNVFLRSKIEFLFNKYNHLRNSNILLFFQDGKTNNVEELPRWLAEWIRTNIGDTMERRKEFIARTGGISPLFYIGTKFNVDMEQSPNPLANTETNLRNRWEERFQNVLCNECFDMAGNLDADGRKTFINWTAPGETFRNSYLLRDIDFSGPQASRLYEGESGPSARMILDREYYDLLRRSFIESDYVRQLFSDPELSWDVACSINNDGSLYIIQNLSRIAGSMGDTRKHQFENIVREVGKKVSHYTEAAKE